MKRKIRFSILAVGVVATAALVYWFYFSKPAVFPSNEQLLNQINDVFPEVKADTIQDTITVDARHKLVPFITKENRYGVSYWVWEKHKWSAAYIDNTGEPRIWKINKKDAATYHFVWNIHPDDEVSKVKFYLLKDRNFSFTNGENYYYPRIQLEKTVGLENKSYGVMALPTEWAAVVESVENMEIVKKPGLWSDHSMSARDMFFGWTPFNRALEETFTENSVNGTSFSTGDETIDFVSHVNQPDLE
jgi:hypothetical protein